MKALLYTLIITGGVYLLICALLCAYQDKFIFFPPAPKAEVYYSVKQNEISFTSPLSAQGGSVQEKNTQEEKKFMAGK